MIIAHCPTTGEVFTESDLETKATLDGVYHCCNCCGERLVTKQIDEMVELFGQTFRKRVSSNGRVELLPT